VYHEGADSEYGDGSSGLGGGSGRRTTSQPRKRAKTEPKKHDWILNNITKIFVMPLNGDNSSSVVSRTMIVF
jgi:hypothetical protein